MSKLSSLYYAHLKEREENMSNYINGTDTVKKLHEFLQLKLNHHCIAYPCSLKYNNSIPKIKNGVVCYADRYSKLFCN